MQSMRACTSKMYTFTSLFERVARGPLNYVDEIEVFTIINDSEII